MLVVPPCLLSSGVGALVFTGLGAGRVSRSARCPSQLEAGHLAAIDVLWPVPLGALIVVPTG